MKDRIPTIPGRVLIHPENGESDFYAILSMADDPAQIGTDLNKANLLSDLTVNALRMAKSPEPTVDLAFRKVAEKPYIIVGSYTGNETAERLIDLGVKPKAVFVCRTNGATYDSYRADKVDHAYLHDGGLASPGHDLHFDVGEKTFKILECAESGFKVFYHQEMSSGLYGYDAQTNKGPHNYIVFY